MSTSPDPPVHDSPDSPGSGEGPAPRHPPVPWWRRHARALGLSGAVVAIGMALLWLVVVPEKVDASTGLQALALRYGHPASWAFLAGVGISVAVGAPRRLREVLLWAALASYAAFVLALVF